MRKLYNELFRVPKGGKICEKVMLTRLVSFIVIALLCLAVMSITAFAYFTHSVTSGSTTLKAANFEAKITIVDENAEPVTVSKEGDTQIASLDAGNHTITLVKGDSSAKTGYCLIKIDGTDYYTAQIGADVKQDKTDATVKFTLDVPSSMTIKFFSYWGTSVLYGDDDASDNPLYIEDLDTIVITPPPPANNQTLSTEPEPETTPSTETTSEPEINPSTETTPDPETTPSTETTPDPETTPSTETTPDPETTPSTETTPEPETTPSTETTPDPETTLSTESTPETETTPSPDVESTPETETTPSPDVESTPETETTPSAPETTDEPSTETN